MNSPEASVVRLLKRHLLSGGFHGTVPTRILVDADPSFVHSRYASELEPMAQVRIGDARPDLLCSIEQTRGTLVTGFEVKPRSDQWQQGLAQARSYRPGVHYSYLALPWRPQHVAAQAKAMAQELGVGLLVLDDGKWSEAVLPAEPTPQPWSVGSTASALDGAGIARSLQLNHPLNYLVVPVLAAEAKNEGGLFAEMERRWPALGTLGTRRHAISGAQTLRLIDASLLPTAEGRAVADLLRSLGFVPEAEHFKRRRLAEAAPAFAAVARFVFLQQSAVRLILRTLSEAGGALVLPQLLERSYRVDAMLSGALFLEDPSVGSVVFGELSGADYNPSTVFKLKQNLWHAGLLATGAHASAGTKAAEFSPYDDTWSIEKSAIGSL